MPPSTQKSKKHTTNDTTAKHQQWRKPVSEFAVTYEDKDNNFMLVGDVLFE
jgi:hypothetical protein